MYVQYSFVQRESQSRAGAELSPSQVVVLGIIAMVIAMLVTLG